MSSMFQVMVRSLGGGPVKWNLGTGAIVGGHTCQGLWLDSAGAIFAVDNDLTAADRWVAGIPLDVNGRVKVTSGGVVTRIAPGPLPLSAEGNVVVDGAGDHVHQGVWFSSASKGAIAVT